MFLYFVLKKIIWFHAKITKMLLSFRENIFLFHNKIIDQWSIISQSNFEQDPQDNSTVHQ